MLFWYTVAVLLSLAIFSFLWKDNPLYKFAEHLFVGTMVGYTIVMVFSQIIMRKIVDPITLAVHNHQYLNLISLIIATLIGLLYLSRFSQKAQWVSRYPISITVGFWSGYAIVTSFKTNILTQVRGTVVDDMGAPLLNGELVGDFIKSPSWSSLDLAVSGPLLVFGVIVVLIYFFFSIKNENPMVRFANKPALLYLMLGFGASFGYTFMGRISLFIGRMNFIFNEWWPLLKQTIGG
jgi:membrane-bound acyltransferase YfiQ involved in biofilm formation